MELFIICTIIILLPNLYLLYKFPNYKKMDPLITYDVALVLGCPARGDGSISRMQKSRMDHAIQLYKNHHVKKLLISGGGVRNHFVEAVVMKQYALQQDIPDDDILIEIQARNTFDNLKNSQSILTKHHLSSMVVVSSGFHLRRSQFFVKKFFDDFVMSAPNDHEKFKHYFMEYFRMWNTLYYEHKLHK